MKKVLGTFLGFVSLALLAGALVLVMSDLAAPSKSPPAAQPAVAQAVATPTPCLPRVVTPVPGAVDIRVKPGDPGYRPELLTPQPVLPTECLDQLPPIGTPWPHVDTKEPPPYMVTPKPVPPTPRPEDPLGPVTDGAASVNPVPDYLDPRSPKLVSDAEAIFVGTVSTVSPSRWATRDGRKPATWGEFETLRSRNSVFYMFTPITIHVEQSLKNVGPGGNVVVTLPGGKADEVQSIWPPGARLIFPPTAAETGKRFLFYTIIGTADQLNALGLTGAIPDPPRFLITLFEITPDGKLPISGPGITPHSITLEEAVVAIKDAVR